MEHWRGTFVAACQLAGIAAAALLLPSAVIDWAFGTDLLSLLAQATLAAFAVALIVAVWDHQND